MLSELLLLNNVLYCSVSWRAGLRSKVAIKKVHKLCHVLCFMHSNYSTLCLAEYCSGPQEKVSGEITGD